MRFGNLEFGLGFVLPTFFPDTAAGEGPIAAALETVLRDDECDTVELSWIKDRGEEQRVRELLETSRVGALYTGAFPYYAGNLDLAAPDAGRRRAAVEALLPWLDQAGRLGCGNFMILSGRDPGAGKRDEAKRCLADSVQRLCDHAARIARPGRPLAVALEHSDRTVDKRCLLGPTPEAVAFADEIRRDHPSFGLVMDLSHLRLLEEGPREAVLTAEGRIVLAHVANCVAGEPENPLFGDKHPPFGVPGSSVGVGEVAGFLSALREAGYLRNEPLGRPATVSLEIKSPPGARPETVLADAKRVLRQAGAMLEEGSR